MATMTLTDDQADYRCATEFASQPKPAPSLFEAVKMVYDMIMSDAKQLGQSVPETFRRFYKDQWTPALRACYEAYEAEVEGRNIPQSPATVNVSELNKIIGRGVWNINADGSITKVVGSDLTADQRRLGLRSTKYLSSTPANMDYD